jgi:hypothetical protein
MLVLPVSTVMENQEVPIPAILWQCDIQGVTGGRGGDTRNYLAQLLPDDRSAGIERRIQFSVVVNLHQRSHAILRREFAKGAHLPDIENRRNQLRAMQLHGSRCRFQVGRASR